MAFTCGFFNSQNGDRKYNAEQMSSIFDGLIKDGVYDTIGDIFAVTPGTGMQVLVGSGRAWFDHTWNNNDAQYPLAITAADVSLPRYDAVVLETNHSDTVRTNRLRVLTGTPASNPVKPTMTSTANVKQHPLAYIKVTAGATAITQSMIQVVVGTSECPFVTGIIETAQIDALFQQWNGEFDEWFENLKAQLSDNVVANLQGQIDQKVAKADVATTADIEAGTSTTKWVTPKGLRDSGNVGMVGDLKVTKNPDQPDNWIYANNQALDANLYGNLYNYVGGNPYYGYKSKKSASSGDVVFQASQAGQVSGVFNLNNKLTHLFVHLDSSTVILDISQKTGDGPINAVDELSLIHTIRLDVSLLPKSDFISAYMIYFNNTYYLYALCCPTTRELRIYSSSAASIQNLTSPSNLIYQMSLTSGYNTMNGPILPFIKTDGNYIFISFNKSAINSTYGGLYYTQNPDLSNLVSIFKPTNGYVTDIIFGTSKYVLEYTYPMQGWYYIEKSSMTLKQVSVTTDFLKSRSDLVSKLSATNFGSISLKNISIHDNLFYGFTSITYASGSSSTINKRYWTLFTCSNDDLSDLVFYDVDTTGLVSSGDSLRSIIIKIGYSQGITLVIIGTDSDGGYAVLTVFTLTNDSVVRSIYMQTLDLNGRNMLKWMGCQCGYSDSAEDGFGIGFYGGHPDSNADAYGCVFIASIVDKDTLFRVPIITDENGYVFIKGR